MTAAGGQPRSKMYTETLPRKGQILAEDAVGSLDVFRSEPGVEGRMRMVGNAGSYQGSDQGKGQVGAVYDTAAPYIMVLVVADPE